MKRTQKGSEDEQTGCGHSAVNGMSSEILYLLDPAQGLFTLEGNTSRRVHARRMAKRHLSRRSQNSYLNWPKFNRFEEANPLASPTRLIDLIAMARGGVR